MTPEKQKRLDEIADYHNEVFGIDGTDTMWLITELRSAWSKLEKAREALEDIDERFMGDGCDTAREALKELEET